MPEKRISEEMKYCEGNRRFVGYLCFFCQFRWRIEEGVPSVHVTEESSTVSMNDDFFVDVVNGNRGFFGFWHFVCLFVGVRYFFRLNTC